MNDPAHVVELYDLQQDIVRKDAALDIGIAALGMLRKTGSVRKDQREEAIKQMQEARNPQLRVK